MRTAGGDRQTQEREEKGESARAREDRQTQKREEMEGERRGKERGETNTITQITVIRSPLFCKNIIH